MQTLNLPNYDFKITRKEKGDFIFDVIRKKNILLTPEEWVRQHMIHYLHKNSGYPKGLLKVESGVMYNARMKRSDIIIYDRKGSPNILVECKAPSVKIDQSTVEQVAMYNRTLNASVIILTNGMVHYTFKLGDKGVLINLDEIPEFRG
ncbi:MAG: type I restriction enzyme HsdR N-terminal domain-containing protein [Cyclobacteriaceae bacterium]|nr:type I restriction enzyme HsdR N-terminal domain-containing protein [Cyclobacteriaceae bacterium]